MTRPDKNRNIFKCRNGEVITVKVTPALGVNYVVNGNPVHPAPGADLTITMDTGANQHVRLTLAFTFEGQTDKYKVQINGDPGEFVFEKDYSGSFAVPGDAIVFFFDVN